MNFNKYFSIPPNISLGDIVFDKTLQQQKNQLAIRNYTEQLLDLKDDDNDDNDEIARISALRPKMEPLPLSDFAEDCLLSLESIPWDNRCVVRIHQGKKPHVENFFKIHFTNEDNVNNKMNRLIRDLVKGVPNTDSLAITSDLTDKVTSLIRGILMEQNNESNGNLTEVELYASFIALDRTKTFGPLSIRRSASLSDRLLKNASRMYVISECLLGGIFFGFRKKITGTVDNSSFSSNTLKVISMGTISKIDCNDLDVSYKNWKESILNNPDSGYPISCKVKNLEEIITE